MTADHFLAYGFGSELMPFTPGTVGSLIGVLAVWLMAPLYLLPPAWRWLVPAFTVYRIFDIWKPFPFGWIEDKLGLGSGIMADDVIAGVYTLAILHAARWALEHFAT